MFFKITHKINSIINDRKNWYPIYMAPELMDENEHFRPGVDVYSFGMMIYEIVTGKEPFFEQGKSINFGHFIQKIMTGSRPSFPSGIAPKMKKLINQCWSQNPIERPFFNEIFKKLSSDHFDEDVDEEAVNDYIEKLKEENEMISSSCTDLTSKNKELKKKIKKEKRKNKKPKINSTF